MVTHHHADGFALAEVVVATAVLAITATAIFSGATAAVVGATRSRNGTLATMLAVQRMEQLRSLTWGFDDREATITISDVSSNLSGVTPGTGGPGLQPSPDDALEQDHASYVDYLDRQGRWLGAGSASRPAATFVRRWRVSPRPGRPNELVLEVVVAQTVSAGPLQGAVELVRLASIKARKAG